MDGGKQTALDLNYMPRPPTIPYLILLSKQCFKVGMTILVLQMKIGIRELIKTHPKSHSQQMAEISQLASKLRPFTHSPVPMECFQCTRHPLTCVTCIISFTPTMGGMDRYCYSVHF